MNWLGEEVEENGYDRMGNGTCVRFEVSNEIELTE